MHLELSSQVLRENKCVIIISGISSSVRRRLVWSARRECYFIRPRSRLSSCYVTIRKYAALVLDKMDNYGVTRLLSLCHVYLR